MGAPFFTKERHRNMRVTKSQALLYIFNTLMEKGFITKAEALAELQISELTFWRNIQEIKVFFYNFDVFYELLYDRKRKRYILIKQETSI